MLFTWQNIYRNMYMEFRPPSVRQWITHSDADILGLSSCLSVHVSQGHWWHFNSVNVKYTMTSYEEINLHFDVKSGHFYGITQIMTEHQTSSVKDRASPEAESKAWRWRLYYQKNCFEIVSFVFLLFVYKKKKKKLEWKKIWPSVQTTPVKSLFKKLENFKPTILIFI